MKSSVLVGVVMTATMALVSSGGIVQAQTTTSKSTTAAADATMGRHTMEGRVTKVNAKKGWVDVKTDAGSMKLHFPPSALENVKAGDSVTVELAMARGASATEMKSEPKTK